MKKLLYATIAGIALFTMSVTPTSSVDAAAKKFKNCTELNKTYKGGVAKNKTVKNVGGKTKYKPHVDAALYQANITKDRDKDGIACER
ncbi:MAG: excalibur calcium-binding domain-containing protein [Exiguobacterium sp.]|uniref:Excalibur calcium-binding domain n=3 Tax=Bacillales Family XII. Incertae Sedis TaxID=539742 RepID=A0A377FTS4_9BACL|nr:MULTISPECIES: excalibur calcium-binding domain-containing protein [Exiguobacterium]MDX5322132.1 excalibur calcium-binding domain-containing protein [Exiguobacterium sp.]MCT4794964.1 excalibur calcium-binding domain-containing protein [Exiguobacterium alkaliphilum]MDX5423846.1 excalibur calcium-binding domain-containing protein [Exiguobacterium sp.]MDX6771382.1 excalibur calcium-binding domain-containing protein [Exiguobacterium sp.]STO08148.1 Excalibur calcium-binding domain [Exiguobacteriu